MVSNAKLKWLFNCQLEQAANQTMEMQVIYEAHIDGLVQDCSNSIANALELLPSCTIKQSIWCHCNVY